VVSVLNKSDEGSSEWCAGRHNDHVISKNWLYYWQHKILTSGTLTNLEIQKNPPYLFIIATFIHFSGRNLTLTKQSERGQLLVVLGFSHCSGQCQLHGKFITEKKNVNIILHEFIA
jgi:hypothetical protein